MLPSQNNGALCNLGIDSYLFELTQKVVESVFRHRHLHRS
ncbi:hypothetical protein FHR99_002889 [Litorivivens lipolytica]|uniref:Uncharacterized protein n=1 Tax=Litorivivens lipolytica TaxID=1524264 RepID=A0A7W4W793_9GAMM|nr:hypothetical protein [Litorivivens lipolytica]